MNHIFTLAIGIFELKGLENNFNLSYLLNNFNSFLGGREKKLRKKYTVWHF